MRRLLFGAVCAAAFAIHATPSEASCIATLNWHGYSYIGVAHQAVPGLKTGTAIALPARVPSCNDTIGPEGPKPVAYTDRAVTRVRGIEPSIAVADAHAVYVSRSTFVAQKSHPLHGLFPEFPEPRITGEPCAVRGVATTDLWGLRVNGARIVVDAKTKVGPQRHGTGFVPPGVKIRVTGSACSRANGSDVYVKATRITRVK